MISELRGTLIFFERCLFSHTGLESELRALQHLPSTNNPRKYSLNCYNYDCF